MSNNKWTVDKKTAQQLAIVSETHREHDFYASCKPLYFLLLKEEINALKKQFPEVDFYPESRLKSFKSCLNKKLDKNKEGKSTDIYDFLAVRYVIKSVDGSTDPVAVEAACRKFTDFLTDSIPYSVVLHERDKDYISNPKPNGYKSLHRTRIHTLPHATQFFSEIQVRGVDMVQESAKHHLYKPVTVSRLVDDIPDIFDFTFDSNGFCTEIFSMSLEQAFEHYYQRPFDVSKDTSPTLT